MDPFSNEDRQEDNTDTDDTKTKFTLRLKFVNIYPLNLKLTKV